MNCDKNDPTCDICGSQVMYERHTQFAGTHYFCKTCAEKETDFGTEIDGQYFWEQKTYNVPSSHQPVSSGALKHWQ